MNNTLFYQAVGQAFPQTDQATKDEIVSKISIHMLEFLKEKAYSKDNEGLIGLEAMLDFEKDENKRSENYGRKITEKLNSLPEDEQKVIMQDFNTELTSKMNQIYTAVNQ